MCAEQGLVYNCCRGNAQEAKGVKERLTEEEKPALEMKEGNRREYRKIQNVHNPFAFSNA